MFKMKKPYKKLKFKCDDCKGTFRNLYFCKGRRLCYCCKRKFDIIIPYPIKFDEYLNESIIISANLTKSQKKSFFKRVKELGISKSEYVRILILSEIKNSKQNKGGNKHEN